MQKNKPFKPTDSELEILAVLWEKNSATVREVHEELAKTKNVGYTTTLKLMQIMSTKGLVSRNKDAKTHVYQATAEKQSTQVHFVNKIINEVFAGKTTELVLHALGENKTSAKELEQIEAFIANLKANK
jgi:BlaI family transcriptional regulator, penicillinase repressor